MIRKSKYQSEVLTNLVQQRKRGLAEEFMVSPVAPKAPKYIKKEKEETTEVKNFKNPLHKALLDVMRQQCVMSLTLKTKTNQNNNELMNILDLSMKSWKNSLGNMRKMSTTSHVTSRHKALRAHIENSLKFRGFCVLDKFLGIENGLKIASEMEKLKLLNRFKKGSLDGANQKTSERKDEVCWVDGSDTGCDAIKKLMSFCDAIIGHGGDIDGKKITMATNAMMSSYPGDGSSYPLHVDNVHKDGRYLTCTYFLNKDWDPELNGGKMRILARTCKRVAEIEPILDRVVFFYSDHRNPHEVLPTFDATRNAVTFWYYDYTERMLALERKKTQLSRINK